MFVGVVTFESTGVHQFCSLPDSFACVTRAVHQSCRYFCVRQRSVVTEVLQYSGVCVERFTSFSLQHEVLAFLLWIFEELVSAHYLSLSSHFVTCIGAASARTLQKTANFLNSLQVAV